MKYALVNPNWKFDGSVYFGCREPHLPIEFGYSRALLEREGHEVELVDGHLDNLSNDEIKDRVSRFSPDMTVIATAPSYLFWRCPPPEVKAPKELVRSLHGSCGTLAAVGPHGSTTPVPVLKKLGVDIVIMGECEEILPKLADNPDLKGIPSICYRTDGSVHIQGRPFESDMSLLPPLSWDPEYLSRHNHNHHRFGTETEGPGAEMESSRGCPYSCTFCAKGDFRNKFRKRPMSVVLKELDGLISSGARYIYFVDEIFMPEKKLLEAISERGIKFGIQTRIDLWGIGTLELLGRAGCVSIEAGIESISEKGRGLLGKRCEATTDELVNLLIIARKNVPFVQATLLDSGVDDPDMVERWRACVQGFGIWANRPVPLFPYPGSEEYKKRWGFPDAYAWERAHEYYLAAYGAFSDIQENSPKPLKELECAD
ncbi:MAG: TIGR04295 family B12-binding domain-containing radical SAM protein [Deltaproteobacteria bacterium]|nr:TIGR04295 family B12-binding domain-containing radical SAM protein [Deltaproteobacteria bacterium]